MRITRKLARRLLFINGTSGRLDVRNYGARKGACQRLLDRHAGVTYEGEGTVFKADKMWTVMLFDGSAVGRYKSRKAAVAHIMRARGHK